MAIATLLVFSTFFVFSSGQSPGDVRLWRNTTISEGRLQIYIAGKWREVCDDGFHRNEADVACHQLGFVDSVYEEAGSGEFNSDKDVPDDLTDIGLSDVHCPTNDYLHLLRCHHQLHPRSCSGKKYINLTCNSTRIWDTPYLGQIRLILGDYPSQGLAQIYCYGGWGTICTDYPFGQNEADTVCRQLGYTSANDYNHLNLRGNYSSPILLSNIDCPTDDPEQCLGACQVCSSRPDRHCTHYNDLNIECGFNNLHIEFSSSVSTCEYIEGGFLHERPRHGEVRLYPQTNSSSGIAELFYDSSASSNGSRSWSRICVTGSDSSDQYTADTFCTQLGYSGASNVSNITATSSVPHLNISCSKRFPHLLWCQSITAVEICSRSLSVTCYHNYTDYYTGQVRLRGGDFPSEGRVEIYVYGVWSSIYTGYYNNYLTEADSVCRQLGYTGAISYGQGRLPGNGTVHAAYPHCEEVMNCFSKCFHDFHDGSSGYFYSHFEDLSVNCTFNISAVVSVGTKDACEIDELPTSEPDNTALVLSLFFTFLFLFACCFVCIVICCVVALVKSSSRAAHRRHQRQFQSGTVPSVGYNPQEGEGGVYMIPANQVPSGGLLLMPAQSQTQSQNETQTEEEEEKSPPKDTDEYFPTPANMTSPDPTSV